MRYLYLLIALLSSSAFATILVPAAPTGSAQEQTLETFLSGLKSANSRGGSFDLYGVSAQFYFVRNSDRLNYLDIVMKLNGTDYLIPTAWAGADNFRQISLVPTDTSTRKAGVYIFQSGFQWNSVLDGLARVDAVIRIAGPDGTVLPSLEYDSSWQSAHQPTVAWVYPPNAGNAIVGITSHPRMLSPLDNDQSIPELQPGTWAYFDANTSLNRAARPELEAWYQTYAFQGISGNAAWYGNDLVFTFNSHVFITPNNFDQTDNLTALNMSADTSAYFMTQGGFRKDSSGQLQRVISTSQIADPSGAILPALIYSERISPISSANSQYVLDVLSPASPVYIATDPHE